MDDMMNSFDLDELCRANLRSVGLPVLDYPEPSLAEVVATCTAAVKEVTAINVALKARLSRWIIIGAGLGFTFGIAVSALLACVAGVL